MSKKNLFGIFAVVVLAGLLFLGERTNEPTPADSEPLYAPIDPRNLTYVIDKRQIPLVDGTYEESIPKSDQRTKTFIIQAAEGDLDGKNGKDYAAIIIDQPGGSGTYYYLYAILSGTEKPFVTKSILLGDRVRPTSLQIIGNLVEVNLLDRAPNEPMSSDPTLLHVSRYRVLGDPPELKLAQ